MSGIIEGTSPIEIAVDGAHVVMKQKSDTGEQTISLDVKSRLFINSLPEEIRSVRLPLFHGLNG